LQEQAVLSDGKKIDYALGVAIGEYRGLRTLSHAGGDAGYRSFVVWFPDHRLGISVLSNAGNFNPGSIANKVAEVYLGSKMAPVPEKPKPAQRTYVSVDPAMLEQYVGDYQMEMELVHITVRDGKLMGAPGGQPGVELRPVGPARFYAERVDTEVEFVPNPGSGMAIRLSGNLAGEGKRVKIAAFDPQDVPKYIGAYWSDELETQYTVVLKEGKLVASHARHGDIALTPVAKDEFGGAAFFMQRVKFVRDGEGRVTGMTVGGGRVRSVRFTRRSNGVNSEYR
jgi:hypothetical protein